VNVRGLTFSRCAHGCGPKPRVALLGGIHGDEIVGGEVLLWFIRHLVTYGTTNADLSRLLDSVDVTIVPMINPDAFLAGTRNTSQNYDMNRSFYPDRCGTTNQPAEPVTEVENLKTFLAEPGFDAVVFMHGGGAGGLDAVRRRVHVPRPAASPRAGPRTSCTRTWDRSSRAPTR
jgi:predicted deacylase